MIPDSVSHGLVQSGFVETDAEDSTPIIDHTLSTVSRVYCGLSKPNGESVSDEDLDLFVTREVSAMFPDGFTVLNAKGGWRDMATGLTVREPSAIIEIAHGSQDKSRVLDLARAYKARFGQQSVMVASTAVATQFV